MSGATTPMQRIASAVALGRGTGRAEARRLLEAMWAEMESRGDALERCALAHALADVQDDPHAELAWDLRALDAARALTDHRLDDAGSAASATDLSPSLHLNVADGYRKTGDARRAQEHLRLARASVAELGGDPYGGMVVDALDRLEARLDLVERQPRGASRVPPSA